MRKILLIITEAERACKTPGAFYDFEFSDHKIKATIKLPPEATVPTMTNQQAKTVEDKLHDALEKIVADMFTEFDPDAKQHWKEARQNDAEEND